MLAEAGTDHVLLAGDINSYGLDDLGLTAEDVAPRNRGARWRYDPATGQMSPDRAPAARLAAYGMVDVAQRLGVLERTAKQSRVDVVWADEALAATGTEFRVVPNPDSDHAAITALLTPAGPPPTTTTT
ncbi:hypothetical protein [Nocardiopsis coralliicola]